MTRLAACLAVLLTSGCGATLSPTIGEVGGPEMITGTEGKVAPAKVKPPYVSFTSGGLTLDRAEWNRGLADKLAKTLEKRGCDIMDGPDLTVSLIGFEHRSERVSTTEADGPDAAVAAGTQEHTATIEVEVTIGKYAKSHTGNATSRVSAKQAISEAAAQALTKLLEDARFRLALTRP